MYVPKNYIFLGLVLYVLVICTIRDSIAGTVVECPNLPITPYPPVQQLNNPVISASVQPTNPCQTTSPPNMCQTTCAQTPSATNPCSSVCFQNQPACPCQTSCSQTAVANPCQNTLCPTTPTNSCPTTCCPNQPSCPCQTLCSQTPLANPFQNSPCPTTPTNPCPNQPGSPCTILTPTLPPTILPPSTLPPPTPPVPIVSATTPPPSAIIKCPPGTILIGDTCHVIYCPLGSVMKNDRCVFIECPDGTIWNGHRCSVPEPIVHNFSFNHTITTYINQTQPNIIFNSTKNIVVNASVTINEHSMNNNANCNNDYGDCGEEDTITAPTTETTEGCCVVMTPRICEKHNSRWHCYSRRSRRCGDFCIAPIVYLKPPRIYTTPQHVIMPPIQRECESYGTCGSMTGGHDCSGCSVNNMSRCSYYCYRYSCPSQKCNFFDQQKYCSNNRSGMFGCHQMDGCYDEWCDI